MTQQYVQRPSTWNDLAVAWAATQDHSTFHLHAMAARDFIHRELDQLKTENTAYEATVQRLENENEQLKRRCESYEEQEMGVAAECCDRHLSTHRTITADELRPGMWVAHRLKNGPWAATKIRPGSEFMDSVEFVLLSEPAEAAAPVKVGDKITTAELLDALPVGTVLLDNEGDGVQKLHENLGWLWSAEGADFTTAAGLAKSYAPLTVLHLPEKETPSA
ncbi:hypothetical protein [Nesterenkonia flava]|uniref:Uncharacterized protein n=1 Tax=Nesterenkonia flava TaxID=469799 RepID=A0ABU1FWA1_9MICC|nr:hypothetical protein [Nesterenkonia flava]MDR5712951.1 hypothetical protein [Nesterenkonia flava]